MANNWNLGLVSKLNGDKSKNQLNQDIKAIQKVLNDVELRAKLDPNQVKNLENQLSRLQVSLTDVTIPQSTLDGLVNQINNALQGIQISNISTGSQVQQVGQQIGQQISQGISQGLGNNSSKLDNFRNSLSNMGLDDADVQRIVSRLGDLKINIDSLSESLNRTNGKKGLKDILTVDVSGTDEFGNVVKKVESFTVAITNAENASNNLVKSSTKVSSSQKKVVEKISSEVDRATKDAEKLSSILSKVESARGTSSAANTRFKDFTDADGVKNAIAEVNKYINEFEQLDTANAALNEQELAYKRIESAIKNLNAEIDVYKSKTEKKTSIDNVDKINADAKILTDNLNKFSSENTGFDTFKVDINGVEVSLENLIDKLKTVDNATDLSTIRSQANALKSEFNKIAEVDEIQLSMSGEGKNSYSLELARITEQYKRLGLEGDKLTKANENVKALEKAHNELADAIAKDVSEYGSLEAKNKAIISADENRIAVLNRVTNEYKEMALTAPKVLTDIQRLNKAESMQKWADGNSKAIRKYGNDINRIIQRFKELDIQMNSIESDKLVAEFKDIQNVARQNNLLGMTTFDKLKNAWKKFGGWSLATGALTKTLHQVKEGVHFIEELDDALTDVNYTSNVSSKQLEYLGDSAINMAKDLKTSASNVLEAVKIYSTANATAEDILRKAKPAIMLSNISGMSGSESSKTINTALNQFEIEDTEENLLDITDTLQYVSSQLNYDFTEGIKEITEGIEASGNVAKNAGLNLQEYATMVGLAVERTGQSGSTIGNAYKTIFSRITAASATEGTLDEDISKAEASLRAIGVQVRDSENDFRDLSYLMADIGKVWDNLTDTQKAKVGYDVAGIRQLNVLNSLFGSWESYSDIISNVDKRTGETLKNQEIYAESLKGHLDGLVTVGQSIWNNIIESKTLKSGIDLLTGLLTIVDKLTESVGALGTIGIGAGLFAGIKNAG